jgi:hypothetical protein
MPALLLLQKKICMYPGATALPGSYALCDVAAAHVAVHCTVLALQPLAPDSLALAHLATG